MKTLKKHLIVIFITLTVAMAFLNSIINSVFNTIAENITNEYMMGLALIIYFIAVILVLVIGAILFVHLISKKIKEENIRYNKEKNILFANIAHDLKTPITTIMGFSKALYDEVVDETEKKELLNSIYGKSKRVNELLDLMFQYAKLDGVDFEMKLQELDVGRLIRETIALYYNEFEGKSIEINIEMPEKPIKLNLDNVEFSRAISNLIINAYRHNKPGSKVAVRLEEDDGIKIIVADNGENIDDEMKEAIFNPFICGDESRNSKEGSGLGLAITKKIVEKHGGKIFIDSNIDGYTKGFVVQL
ncbi:sensor histidine kinase [Clostridium estertheticum]|uniref:sensor histidine kinase n=2 Tax=Clostridium estertheticum TaxID=238834 RepID=UPI001CF2EF0B|nr:HAMP domain-containing sensor histidine kinase [Clostridium estertheticum]MCB2343078.1 HAMP domain-containing histidine kinase [Clostridium estertheticum]